MKGKYLKSFVNPKTLYFELGIFSFNSHVYYLTVGFIPSTRAFNLPSCVFHLVTSAFSLLTHAFTLLTCGFELVIHRF